MTFYKDGRPTRFRGGRGLGAEAVLASPQFLFRLEPVPGDGGRADLPPRRLRPGLAAVVLPVGHGPDAELIKAARPGVLATAGARQAGHAHAGRPAGRGAGHAVRGAVAAPAGPRADAPTRFSIRTSTRRWRTRWPRDRAVLRQPVREDRSVLDLLTADYTFVNERLARHYGIPNVNGDEFRRVTLPDRAPRPAGPGQRADAHLGGRPHLAGAARQVGDGSAAGLAAAGAAAQRAGARGRPRPPPRAEACCPCVSAWSSTASNPACNSCHRVIDPLGLALENFDVTGAGASRTTARRSTRPATSTTARRWTARPACARRCSSTGRVQAQLHREPDDLRPGAAGRSRRHADGAPHCPRCRRRRPEARRSSRASSKSPAFQMGPR
jgi:hypothetical protein